MPGEVPEAGFPGEAAVDEHIKAVYTEKRGITLPTGEDV
jgi:hypothetical protein